MFQNAAMLREHEVCHDTLYSVYVGAKFQKPGKQWSLVIAQALYI